LLLCACLLQACVAELRGRKSPVTCLSLLREDVGGVVVFGDEAGESGVCTYMRCWGRVLE
jgi:hypothetical protein